MVPVEGKACLLEWYLQEGNVAFLEESSGRQWVNQTLFEL